MRTRTKVGVWFSASLVLCTIVACTVVVESTDDGIKISNELFTLTLGASGTFELRLGGDPVQSKVEVVDLFASKLPTDTPGSAVVSLDTNEVAVLPLGELKAQTVSQAISGTAQLNIYIGPSTTIEPCDEGIFIGTFQLSFGNGLVSVDRVNLDIPSQALAWILSGSFTLCLEMTADVDVLITIDGIAIEFGPPVQVPGDNQNENTAENVNENIAGNENDNQVANDNVADNENENTADNVNDNVVDNANGNVTDNANDNVTDNVNDNTVDNGNVNDNVSDLPQLLVAVEGEGTVDPAGGEYEPGTWAELTAVPADGWRFYSWQGDLTGTDNPASLVISEDASVTAVFVPIVASEITFQAVYDRLWDTGDQNPGYGILHAAMSGDGNRLVWAVLDNDTGALSIVTMNVDGSDQTIIPAPAEVDSIWEVAINYDGSRAFFRRWFDLLYKVEGGAITQILNTADVPGLAGVQSLQPTTTGDYVYFLEDDINDNDVWRIAGSGGLPELVINDTEVLYDNGFAGAQVSEFSASADGSVIAFAMYAYWGDTGYSSQTELFVLSGGSFTQLTSDPEGVNKSHVTISGDGSTIVYYSGSSGGTWYSVNPDGSNQIALATTGFNVGGPALTYDGSKMFYNDSAANGSLLMNTDGSGRIHLFPAWNVTNIAIDSTGMQAISDDGTRIAFWTEYGVFPLNAAYHVGYLNDPTAVPDAPSIDRIAFSPAAYPRIDPQASLYLHASISDPGGLADVTNAAADSLVDGVHAGYEEVPAYFYFAPRDNGEAPDDTAADGVFVSAASAGEILNTLDQVTIRVSAKDASHTVVVADAVLAISGN